MPADCCVSGDTGRLVDSDDVVIGIQDGHTLDIDRGVLHGRRSFRQRHDQPCPGLEPIRFANGYPINLDTAILGNPRRGGSRQPQQSGQAGIDSHPGQTLGHGHRSLGHQADSAVSGSDPEPGEPSGVRRPILSKS